MCQAGFQDCYRSVAAHVSFFLLFFEQESQLPFFCLFCPCMSGELGADSLSFFPGLCAWGRHVRPPRSPIPAGRRVGGHYPGIEAEGPHQYPSSLFPWHLAGSVPRPLASRWGQVTSSSQGNDRGSDSCHFQPWPLNASHQTVHVLSLSSSPGRTQRILWRTQERHYLEGAWVPASLQGCMQHDQPQAHLLRDEVPNGAETRCSP